MHPKLENARFIAYAPTQRDNSNSSSVSFYNDEHGDENIAVEANLSS